MATSLDIGLSNLSLKTITLSFYSRFYLTSKLLEFTIDLANRFFPQRCASRLR